MVAAGGVAGYASTVGFGDNQVGATTSNGIQVSDDQVIKPLGERTPSASPGTPTWSDATRPDDALSPGW
jgi:hypothetical protein